MERHWLAGALLAVTGLLGGCGGGGGGGSAPRVEGLLVGSATRSSTEREAIVHASEGRLMAIEVADGAFFFDAQYTIADGALSGTARIYGTNVATTNVRYFTETATVSGTAGEDAWAFTITGAGSTTTFALAHHPQDTDDSSLAAVTGTWIYDPVGSNTSTLTVAADGATSTTNDSGCASSGSIAVIDQDYNLYDSATTVTDATGGCPNSVEGSYSGLISLFEYVATGEDQLVVMLAKADFMLTYLYTRQP